MTGGRHIKMTKTQAAGSSEAQMRAIEFFFEGERLTLATEDEFKRAVMFGRLVERKDGLSRYRYKDRDYLLSSNDLQAVKAASIE